MALPTVAALVALVDERCAVPLAEAGEYFKALGPDADPVTPAIAEGLRRGVHAVGVATADPLAVADADVADLSGFALERVVDVAELFALAKAVLQWHRALQRYALQPIEPQPMQGGWLMEQKRAVKERIAELRAVVAEPYREPSDQVVVTHPPGLRQFPCWFDPADERARVFDPYW